MATSPQIVPFRPFLIGEAHGKVLADVIKRLTEEKGIIGLDRLQTTRQASKFRRGMGTLYNLAKGKGGDASIISVLVVQQLNKERKEEGVSNASEERDD
jgi:hypothetical protein